MWVCSSYGRSIYFPKIKRGNDNLEQQAQALFKSWFVDNSNPNLEETSLSEVASFVGGYSYTGEELTDCSNIAMATIKTLGEMVALKLMVLRELIRLQNLKNAIMLIYSIF